MRERGYLYVATGAPRFFEEAITSVRSLKRVSPDAHASILVAGEVLASVGEMLGSNFDQVIEVGLGDTYGERSASQIGHLAKVRALSQSAPYERTIFVDTDTYFLEPIDGLFDTLDYFDLAVAVDPVDMRPTRDASGRKVAGMTPYNTGLVAFDRQRCAAFLKDWTERHERLTASADTVTFVSDQASFAAALLHSSVRFLALQPSWNARLPYPGRFAGPVKMIHTRPAEMRGMSLEVAAKRVNRIHESRVWLPLVNETIERDVGLGRWLLITARNLRHLAGVEAVRQTRRFRK